MPGTGSGTSADNENDSVPDLAKKEGKDYLSDEDKKEAEEVAEAEAERI